MKGLLAKDLALMIQRAKIMLFLIIWGIIMVFIMEDSAFVVGWMVMIAAVTSLSPISYDEYDNCMPFLMSLPVTRRTYAVERYVFSLLFGAAFWVLSVAIVAIFGMISGNPVSFAEDLPMMAVFLAVLVLVVAVSVPPQLKWGSEKGRMVLLLVYVAIFGGFFIFAKMADGAADIGSKLEAFSLPGVVIALLAADLAILALSAALSIRIMEKKEF